MTLQEIITEIKGQYAYDQTVWTDDRVVAFLNDVQNRIFDKLQVEAFYDSITVTDQMRYALPADMQIDKIKTVLISNDEQTTVQSGTVSVSAGAKTVTGSGTSFTSALEGEYIVINDELKIVDTVSSTTSMTVTTNFASDDSGAAWYLYATPEEDVTFTEYYFEEYNTVLKRATEQCYYKYRESGTDYLGIYPAPSTTGKTVRIIYTPKATTLTNDETGLAATPDLFYRWHYLLVYAAISEIAGSGNTPDHKRADDYAIKYNYLLQSAMEDGNKRNTPGYRKMRDRMKSWNYSRRALRGGRRKLPWWMYEESE